MKLSKVTMKSHPSEGGWCLILESLDDLMKYSKINGINTADSALGLWNRLKEYQSANLSMDAYHAAQGEQGIARLMAFHLENPKSENKETSIVEYCNIVDGYVNSKYDNMADMLSKGLKVQTNWNGGYSQHDEFFICLEDKECNDDTLIKYLTTGEVEEIKLEFDKEVLVLENDELPSPYIYKCLRKHDYNEYQIVNRFRVRMMNKSKEDIYKLFDDAIKNKLEVIYVETTLQDKNQFESIQLILESIMKNNPKKHLLINLNLLGVLGKEGIKTDIPNIKLKITNNRLYNEKNA